MGPEEHRSSPGAAIFVWGVWATMVVITIWHFAYYARNLPLAEDWNLVAALTGHEPDLGSWLWSQNNEHRLPLPRLIMLGLLKLSGGDFRSGMILNMTVIALLAGAMILTARHIRGGRLRYTDAFFPIVLLEVGDWQNLYWHWQHSFVLSVVLACAGLLAIISRPRLDTPAVALTLGAALVLEPLTGGSGLVFVPPLLLYAAWMGIRLARESTTSPGARRASRILIGSALVSTAIIVFYLANYHQPDWVPENPGLLPSIRTMVQFQTFGLGPAVRTSWTFWSIIAVLLLLAAVIRVLQSDRLRKFAFLACLLSVAGAAAAIGWGRAAVIDVYHGWPDRYVLLSAPAFCVAYFVFELPGSEAINRAGRVLLVGLAAVLLPMNMAFGREYGTWYADGMDRVLRDINAGIPLDILAQRHNRHLYHAWAPARLAAHMQMLRDRRIGPFGGEVKRAAPISGNLDSVTVRYLQPDAGEVHLVWWLRKGGLVPPSIRPPGTVEGKQGTAVDTRMARIDSGFTVTLAVPATDSLSYGFLITARNDGDTLMGIWDGTHQYEPDSVEGDTIVEARPTVSLLTNPLRGGDTLLVQQTLRYGPTDARRVRVLWGVDDWQQLPPSAWPPRTRATANHLTLTAMERKGSMFETTLPVPSGRRLDFSFQLDRADRVEVSDDNNGRNYRTAVTHDTTVTIGPSLDQVEGGRTRTVFLTGISSLFVLGLGAALAAGIGALRSGGGTL